MSRGQARRVGLAAQRFGVPRPANVSTAHLRRLIEHLGAIQIDSVNVLVRSHYLPAFSRFGPYDRTLLERVAYGKPRRIFEYWGHEASLLPVELFPLLRWRMERSRSGTGVWQNVAHVGREKRALVERVRETIAERGAMSASDFETGEVRTPHRGAGWWSWSDTKRAIEYLFWCGELTPLERRNSFERVYDLTERVIPPEVLRARVEDSQAYAALVELAARSFGVAVEADLRDYFRLPLDAARNAVRHLVESGRLSPVRVEGWKQQAYLHADARVPRRIEGSALLSPFDSLVWNRERAKRLFDFHYRIEIYTPAHKRVHGYYVLPYLLDDALVARVDVKADRAGSTLLVHAIHYEPRVDRAKVRARLTADLRAMAGWLGLERIKAPR
ncbi:MAG TPA: crosslink repair DNA glycosylase YcaQ family protein [Candidatus Baltobacteraceae bacterium]